MKKFATLLAVASLTVSSFAIADEMTNSQPLNPNDVMQTVPHQGDRLTIAEATTENATVTTDKTVNTPKAVKKKNKKHSACSKKKNCKTKKCCKAKKGCKTKKHTRKTNHRANTKPTVAPTDTPPASPAAQ